MPDRSRRRAAPARTRGRRRASQLADRLGAAIRAARLRAGWTQRQLGERAGVSQGWLSEAERGLAPDATVETWAALGAALYLQLAAFFELAPGATPPRDVEHLRRQQVVITTGAGGGWAGRPETAVVTADGANRSIDVLLERPAAPASGHLEIVVVEIVDLFTDLGEDLRGLERKVEAVRSLRPTATVRGLLVV
ncbi:MAG: helix-turn-helix transcriptional regulator, partial [Chloroflexi bacterium]|nr:helix-turn-helix transcriptional regulator [Chloroflexota bacterium]